MQDLGFRTWGFRVATPKRALYACHGGKRERCTHIYIYRYIRVISTKKAQRYVELRVSAGHVIATLESENWPIWGCRVGPQDLKPGV